MKEIFKGAATRASCGVGPFRDFYETLLSLAVSNNTLFGAFGSSGDSIGICRLLPVPPSVQTIFGRTIQIPANVYRWATASLLEACRDEASVTTLELEGGKHPQVVVGWGETQVTNSVLIRLLSVDCPDEYLNYTGDPY